MQIDLGDVVAHFDLKVKCCQRRRFVFHIGVPTNTTPDDRIVKSPTRGPITRRDVSMDLKADQKVALSGKYTDEVGNEVPAPDGAAVTYTVDDTTVINLTDNGDGTAEAAATGTLGQATVHADAGTSGSADLLLVVVAGDAERFEIVAGTPEEVTPDV